MKFGVILFMSIITLLVFSGCTAKSVDPTIAMKPPAYVEQLPSKEKEAAFPNEGSLFGRGDNPLFSDRKAMNVNDLVTVVIDETVAQSSSSQKSLSKNFTDAGTNAAVNGAVNKINGITNLGFQTGSQNSFSSKGDNTKCL